MTSQSLSARSYFGPQTSRVLAISSGVIQAGRTDDVAESIKHGCIYTF